MQSLFYFLRSFHSLLIQKMDKGDAEMNKAKMTFRFDHDPGRQRGADRIVKESQPTVIPLRNEEYRVLDEKPDPSDTLQPANLEQASVSITPQPAGASQSPFIDGQALNQYTTDFGGWQSSFDIETQRVEKLIRDSGGSTMPQGTSVHPESGYIDTRQADSKDSIGHQERYAQPELEPLRDHRWYVPEETAYITKRPGSSWIKIVTSVTGAVITGVAFGFFVLSMFSDDAKDTQNAAKSNVPSGQSSSVAASTSPAGDKTTAAAGAKAAGGGTAALTSSAATVAVNIGAKTYSFLQSGVFSTSQSADAAQADLKKKGFGAVSEAGDKYPVYVGMSLTRDDALGLAQQFQQKKMDVLVKSVELPAVSKMKWSGKSSDAFASYVSQGDKLLGLIAPVTTAKLAEAKPGPLSDASVQSIKTAHQTWTGLTAAATEGLADDAKAAVQKMNTALNTAVVSLDEYKKNPAPSYMWQAQTALMQYVISQKELRKAVSVQ
ncbi:hypothetical protein CF651_08425 [Paenibacillus rigui]|uniref:SPOR domain-containing protein n=2 Tax=Paenibacillus rigui TaxID=554312 RepID=A0A229UUM5_9BACL|nr:hypothetical protein CF651_08425 [Paenibacillus rigui]